MKSILFDFKIKTTSLQKRIPQNKINVLRDSFLSKILVFYQLYFKINLALKGVPAVK